MGMLVRFARPTSMVRSAACVLVVLAAGCGSTSATEEGGEPGLGAAPVAAGCPTSPPAPTPDPDADDFTSFPVRDDAVVDGIVELARSRYPELYTGLSMRGSTIVVHRKRAPGSPLDDAIKQKYPAQAVAFDDTAHTERELIKLRDRVLADDTYWEKQQINLASVGLMPTKGVAYAEIKQKATDDIKAAFRDRYGDGLVLEGCAAERRMF